MEINQITIDLNQLTKLELLHMLLRLGLRQRTCLDQFYRTKYDGFGKTRINKFNKECGGARGRSGQLPSLPFDTISDGYWHPAPRQLHSAIFWHWWLTAQATMEYWPAFIAAWTKYLQSVDSPEINIDRAFHLTQQNLELVTCRMCSRQLLRACWEVRKECPVCSGRLATSLSMRGDYKHTQPASSQRVALFLEGMQKHEICQN